MERGMKASKAFSEVMLSTVKELELMSSVAAGTSRVALRQSLPLHSTAIVERCLGEGRFLVSDADSTMQLKLFQSELNDEFSRIQKSSVIEQPNDKITAGELCLYRDSSLEVFRARILQVGAAVSCRLIDFGLCITVRHENFYSFSEADFEKYRSLRPFVSRVNLPPDEVLSDLGLPTASMVKEGDVVDMILFTTTEPQLAVFSFGKYYSPNHSIHFLARSDSYRFLPEMFTAGFDKQACRNWDSLFSYDSISAEPTVARHGFGQLKKVDFHSNRLALIAYVKSLDKVYVHDLNSAIRISFLRERLDMIYGNEKIRSQFVVNNLSELPIGTGCVAYHKNKKIYVRVEVIAAGSNILEVAPIDMPSLGIFSVVKEFAFKIPKSLQFPRQCFAVRMTRHSDGQNRHYLASLARCILPDKTPVILDSEPTIGLVKIFCSNAPKGVLAKIGFNELNESKFSAEIGGTKIQKKFGEDPEVVAAEIEDISRFATRTCGLKPKKPSRPIISSQTSSKPAPSESNPPEKTPSESTVSFSGAESAKSIVTFQSEAPSDLS